MPTTSKYHDLGWVSPDRVSGSRVLDCGIHFPTLFIGAPAFPLSKQILEMNTFPAYVL
jgi:hypothetical protein